MIGDTFYGEWISSTSTNMTEDFFQNNKGLVVINPYNAGADFVLLDSQYIDQRFVYYEFKLGEEIANKAIFANGTLTFKNKELLYWTGADLLRQGMTKSQKCSAEELTFKVLNVETNRVYDPETDEDKNAAVIITMKKGTCPFDFGTTLMKAQDEVLMSQIWIFSLLYFIWSVPNIMIGLIKFRDLDTIDKAEGAQFFLIFNINFYVSMWNNLFAQEIAGNIGLILVAILNLFIWSSNFGTSFRCVQGRRNPCFLAASIFFTAVMRIIFTYSHAVLLMIFILVPLIDIVKSLKGQSRPRYDFLLYFGILLPNLLIIAYLSLYGQNFARLSPQPGLFRYFIVFLILAFGVLPTQVEVKKFILRLRRDRRYVSFKDINAEEICPICMQSFSETELKVENPENPENPEAAQPTEEPKDLENPQPRDSVSTNNQSKVASSDVVQKVLKTECGHLFHENCLNEWLKIKAECPSCRKPVIDFI